MKTVLIPIADGTEELEAVTIIDLLRRAGAEVTVASVGELTVKCAHGTKVTADCIISECQGKTFDLIVLPGGLPGADHLRNSTILTELLKDQSLNNRLFAAICAAPAVVLHSHGLLKGRKATCYPGFGSDFENHSDERVVVDGNCITSQGPSTAMEFSLVLVEMLVGKEMKNNISNALRVSD